MIYSRVSTDAQERDGTSLDTQERACLDHVSANGWLAMDRIRDTASGFTLQRRTLLVGLEQATAVRPRLPALTDISETCRRVETWVHSAQGDDFGLPLEALQTEVTASRGKAILRGVIPEYAHECNDADVRPVVIISRR